jgi:hypothetical protein
MPKTHWQKQQQRQNAATAAAPVTTETKPWYVTLVDVLEGIWTALPASQSEPNHPVSQNLAALKASVPK